MHRLLLPVLLLAAGCAKPTAPTLAAPQPTGVGPAPTTPAYATPSVADQSAPELQPIAKFDLGGAFSHVYSLDVQITPDGKRLAIAVTPTDGKPAMQVWGLGAAPKRLYQSEQTYGGVTPALSPSGKRVVAHGKVYDVDRGDAGKPLATLPGGYYSHAFFAGEDRVIATMRSHGFDKLEKGAVTIWDVAANKDAGSFEVPDKRFTDAFPANGGRELWLFQAADRCVIECWDTTTGKLLRAVKPAGISPPPTSSGLYCAVAPDGSVFATLHKDYTVYDGVTGAAVGGMPGTARGGLTNGLTPGGTRALATAYEVLDPKTGVVTSAPVLVDWKGRRRLATLRGFSAGATDLHAVASADGKTAVAVSKQGQALVYDLTQVK